MKKLMIVAAAALGMTAFADIESVNVVGYANGQNTVGGYNFVAVGFNSIGCNTFDIQQICIGDGGEGSIGFGTEVFSIWAGGPDVVEGTTFFYYDPMLDPDEQATTYYWGDSTGAKANLSVAAGQAVVVECGEGLSVLSSGEVPSAAAELTTEEGYNFVANPFPVALDIQQLSIDDGGEGSIGFGTEVFSIWAGGPDVVEGTTFFYYDPMLDPDEKATTYYWGDSTGAKAVFSFEIGQGAVIECAAGLSVKIEPPYVK